MSKITSRFSEKVILRVCPDPTAEFTGNSNSLVEFELRMCVSLKGENLARALKSFNVWFYKSEIYFRAYKTIGISEN